MKIYKLIFLTFIFAITFFIVGIEEVEAGACLFSSNCDLDEYCSWGWCRTLSCFDPYPPECTTNALCGSGKFCGADAGYMIHTPVDHTCSWVTVGDRCQTCTYPNLDCNLNGGCETTASTDWHNCGTCGNDCADNIAYPDFCSSGILHSFPGPCDSGSCREDTTCTETCCDSYRIGQGYDAGRCSGGSCFAHDCDSDNDGYFDANDP